MKQSDIFARSNGCAIEARIYAENPLKDFLPCSGELIHLAAPAGGAFSLDNSVRVDSGIARCVFLNCRLLCINLI